MNDDRISRYLNQQADGIALSSADPADVMRRGGRRRTRRRAALVGSVAAVGLLATSVAVRDSGNGQEVRSLGASATASTYDWSTVTPASGLGYGSHSAQLADGSVYSISTAPGPYQPDGPQSQFASTLYRSTDGSEWSAASLPSGVRSSDLAGAGDTLYSVGTAPSGGLVLSASTDGAASWTSASLPDDVVALQARHPGQIIAGPARVAARDGSHVVATIVATTQLDLTKLGHPEYPNDSYTWDWTDTGVTVSKTPISSCGTTDPVALDKEAGIACREDVKTKVGDQVASYTYDELGVTGELRDHVGGKSYVYASDDGHTFDRVDLPAEVTSHGVGGFVATPAATADGYRLVTSSYEARATTSTILASTDGRTWTIEATLPGSPNDVGVLNGRLALSTWSDQGASSVKVEQADGSFSTLDLASAVATPAGASTSVDTVSFGPLGIAAVVGTAKEGGPYVQHIVHSADGATLQVQDVASLVHNGGQVVGLLVTPDAIVARVTTPGDDDVSTPPTQEVLVGTPR